MQRAGRFVSMPAQAPFTVLLSSARGRWASRFRGPPPASLLTTRWPLGLSRASIRKPSLLLDHSLAGAVWDRSEDVVQAGCIMAVYGLPCAFGRVPTNFLRAPDHELRGDCRLHQPDGTWMGRCVGSRDVLRSSAVGRVFRGLSVRFGVPIPCHIPLGKLAMTRLTPGSRG
jgi:hypothetical protein